MYEAEITINGITLTLAQSMTVRVAVSSFLMSLQESGLGDDEHGKTMTASYLATGGQVLQLIHKDLWEDSNVV